MRGPGLVKLVSVALQGKKGLDVNIMVRVQDHASLVLRANTSRLLARNHAQVTPTILVLQGNI